MLLGIIFALIVVVWAYILWGRTWLNTKLTGTSYDRYRLIADKFWMQSRTVLVGRIYWLIGVLLALNQIAIESGFDFTPVYSEIAKFAPEPIRPFIPAMIIYATGIIIVKLRKMTAQAYEERDPKEPVE